MEQRGNNRPQNSINPNNINRNRINNNKNARNKKRLKIIGITVAALVVIAIAAIVTIILLVFNGFHEDTPFADRSDSYSMPSLPPNYLDNSGEDVSLSESDIKPEPGKPIYKVNQIDKNILNILLVGKETTNSDSMIVASYNKETGKIVLGSFLRDSYVPIELNSGTNWRKLNATFPLGGIGLTINTINQIYNLDIQRYVTVDFDGFTKIIDILGGIDIDVSETEANVLNDSYQLNIKPGMQTLNGDVALKYSRIRHGCGDDYARADRQRKVITTALNKMYSTRNPAKVTKLVKEGMQYVKTNLELGEITSLLSGFMGMDKTNIDSVQFPANGMFKNEDVKIGNVLIVDFDKNKAYIRQKLYG